MRRMLGVVGVLVALAAVPSADAIVGGSVAPARDARSMARVADANGAGCGATAIAPTWLLTAAHCVDFFGVARPPITATIGRADLRNTNVGEQRAIVRMLTHPRYDRSAVTYDAALLELASPTSAPPMRLARPQDDALIAPLRAVKVFGWGVTQPDIGLFPVQGSAQLRVAELRVVPDALCAAEYALLPATVFEVRIRPAVHVCAGGVLRDSCSGDSGGPLTANTPSGPTQVGLVSWGYICALPTHPGVYTELTNPAINAWIRSTAGIG